MEPLQESFIPPVREILMNVDTARMLARIATEFFTEFSQEESLLDVRVEELTQTADPEVWSVTLSFARPVPEYSMQAIMHKSIGGPGIPPLMERGFKEILVRTAAQGDAEVVGFRSPEPAEV